MDNPRKINEARAIALRQRIIESPEELQISKAKGKRFSIKVNDKIINFGLFPYAGKGTFLDHKDDKIKSAWIARHSKIKLKDGRFAYKVVDSPEYLAYNILWA